MLDGLFSRLLLGYRILFGAHPVRGELCTPLDGFVHCIYIILDIQHNPCKPRTSMPIVYTTSWREDMQRENTVDPLR